MARLKTFLAGALLSLPLFVSANNEDAPLQIDANADVSCSADICLEVFNWTITSLDDDLEINNVIINRGRCQINTPNGGKGENRVLQYSDTWSFTTPTDQNYRRCRPLEAKVQTNRGEWSFTF